jgi:LCP family protein required for cell wall assembly
MSKHLEPPRRGYAPGPDAPSEPPSRQSWRRWFPYAFLALMLVFATFCGVVAAKMVQTKQNFGDALVGYFVPSPESIFGKDRIIVGLLGLDYDYTDKDIETSADARTDKLSVFALDFPTGVVKEIAVPRDSEAMVAGHLNKINAAYAIGKEPMTDQVTGEFLGLPRNDKGHYFDRYIILRIDATKDFINAIGGLDVNVDEEMNYDDSWGHLHIHFHPGLQHMNGDQAVSFARFRHDACSDPCRIKRQQMIEQLAIEKLKSQKFNDLAHIAELINVIRRDVITNLTTPEMTSLAWHFKNISLANVKQTQIPFKDDVYLSNAGDVLIPDDAKKAEIVADFLGPYTAATPPPDVHVAHAATVPPANVHVVVQNGSGESGLGKRMADALRARGYVVDSISNADSFDYDTTVIREHSKVPGVGEQVRSQIALKTATVTPAPQASAKAAADSSDVTVIVGKDFASAVPVIPQKSAQ